MFYFPEINEFDNFGESMQTENPDDTVPMEVEFLPDAPACPDDDSEDEDMETILRPDVEVCLNRI